MQEFVSSKIVPWPRYLVSILRLNMLALSGNLYLKKSLIFYDIVSEVFVISRFAPSPVSIGGQSRLEFYFWHTFRALHIKFLHQSFCSGSIFLSRCSMNAYI